MKTARGRARGRRTAAALLLAALLLGLSACGGEKKTEEDASGVRFTVAVAQTPDSLNPLTASGGLAGEIFLLCYDPLWRLDDDGLPQPCLVDSWSLSSDRLTWTIRLRQDAVFSDGVPLTAADVVFTYELMRHNDTSFTDYFEGITAVRQADDYTVVISTSSVKGDMLYNPAPILPRHIWKDWDYDPAGFDNGALVGSGPFVYDEAASGQAGWLLRAREDYFGGAAQISEVYFALYGTTTGAARAVAGGEADASFGLSDVQLTTLEGVPGLEMYQAMLPGAEVMMLVFNCRTDFFSGENLRTAVEYSADRDWFLSMAVGGAGLTGSSFFSPGADGFAVPDGLRGYDTAEAQRRLAAAGFTDIDGDGVLEYGIRDTKLSLCLVSGGQESWSATAATILAADLGEIGVRVDWVKTDGAVTSVCGKGTNWDMCLIGFRGGVSPAVTVNRFLDQIASLAGWDLGELPNYVRLLREAEDPTLLQGTARQIQQMVYNACPVVVLGCAADIQAIRGNLWSGWQGREALFGTGSIGLYMNLTPTPAEG